VALTPLRQEDSPIPRRYSCGLDLVGPTLLGSDRCCGRGRVGANREAATEGRSDALVGRRPRRRVRDTRVLAAMVEALALEGGERVLEIGTGLGYQAAIPFNPSCRT
jgi:hypothetical protein